MTKKCSRCGRLVETKGFKTCDTCREESREYRNQHREHEQERQIEWQRLSRKKKREARYLEGIYDKYTHDELKAISKGKGVYEFTVTPPKVNIDHTGEEIRFGFFTDSHMGSIYYHEAFLDDFIKTCKEKKAQFCIFGGDLTHGMDSRKYNLLYELKHIGYAAQKEYAEEQLAKIPFPTYVIDGNHDRWYESIGAHIVKDICDSVPNAEYIGRDEGDIVIKGIIIRVFHGEDGSSYAVSYRIQKLIECVPLDSEILTKDGWKKYNEINVGDLVLGYNNETERCEWTRLTAINRYNDAEVVEYKNDFFRVRVTRDHKWAMTIEHRAGRNKNSVVPTRYSRTYKGLVSIDEASGNWRRPRIIQAAPGPDGGGLAIKEHLDWINREDSINKVMEMTSSERKGFILGMVYGEGAHVKNKDRPNPGGTIVFAQNPGTLNEAFKLACFLEGVAVGTTKRVSKKMNGDTKINCRTTMLRKPHRMISAIKEIGKTVEDVWCPTTELGTWVMRQGDTITITGNSITGGEKPNVLLMGHAHKQGYFFERNIHAVSGGALSTQSKWMRSKRMANHAGYHFITMRVDDEGVAEFTLTFRPFYV